MPRRPPRRLLLPLALLLLAPALASGALASDGVSPGLNAGRVRASEARADAIAASPACREGRLSARYLRRLGHALRSRRDAWGRALLAARSGPTYERASRFLPPLFLARAADGRPLTESGVHYTHFSQPESARGASSVALHVADGSQIISRRAHGPRLTIRVGQGGSERYGSCLRRLELPRLADGYLPILQTRYVDGHGVRYEQESFAAHVPETGSLVSFLKLTADATASSARNLRLRFIPSPRGLGSDGSRLLRRGRTYLVFSEGGAYRPPALTYAVPPGGVRTVVVAWLHRPARSRPLLLDELRYEEERENVRRFWERKLAHGGLIVVPEQRVLDAERNLLIQNLGLTWRYSVGNRYEQLSTPEAVDVARVLAAYGHYRVSRAILRTAVRKKPLRPLHPEERRTSWRIGARLVGFADYARLAGDRAEIARALPDLRRYVRRLERQLRASRTGLLPKERFSSDVPDRVYGLHAQAAVWQGLRWIGPVLREAGYPRLAATCARLAARLERGLRRGVRRSERRLPGGALFVPVRLLEDVRPYRSATSSRDGSYWNLVLPYALASGLFPPRGRRAEGVLRYLERHGTRLLGLVRAGAYGLYGTDARGKSGSSPVYGINLSRFLADNDRPDELVLSLYGQLAAGMTPGTFVSGESVSIAPLEGRLYRSAYLPPNGTSNAAFLETLRLLVVHERRDRTGLPRGLELAYATPRGWLRPGRRIEVRRLATSFGRLSYAIDAGAETVEAVVQVPDRAPLGSLRLRLRLPGGKRVAGVLVNGQPGRLLPDGETVELPTRPGELRVEARVG